MPAKPTIEQELALEAMSRAMAPEAWAEYDAALGLRAERQILETIAYAEKLISKYPGIVDTVNAQPPQPA